MQAGYDTAVCVSVRVCASRRKDCGKSCPPLPRCTPMLLPMMLRNIICAGMQISMAAARQQSALASASLRVCVCHRQHDLLRFLRPSPPFSAHLHIWRKFLRSPKPGRIMRHGEMHARQTTPFLAQFVPPNCQSQSRGAASIFGGLAWPADKTSSVQNSRQNVPLGIGQPRNRARQDCLIASHSLAAPATV